MIHPKMCPDGRYPYEFHEPTPLRELARLPSHDLDNLLLRYEIFGESGRYRGLHSRRYATELDVGLSRLSKTRKFLALFDFLGASTLAELFRTRSVAEVQSVRRPAMMRRAITYGPAYRD